MRIGDGWKGEKKKRSSLVCASSFFTFLFSFWVRHSPFNCGPLCVRVFAVWGGEALVFFSCPMAGNRKVDPAKLGGKRLDSSFSSFVCLSPPSLHLYRLCIVCWPGQNALLTRPPLLKRNGTRRVHADVGCRKEGWGGGLEKVVEFRPSLTDVCVYFFCNSLSHTHDNLSVLLDRSYVTSSPHPKKEIDYFLFFILWQNSIDFSFNFDHFFFSVCPPIRSRARSFQFMFPRCCGNRQTNLKKVKKKIQKTKKKIYLKRKKKRKFISILFFGPVKK
jgi:hypothetical protein